MNDALGDRMKRYEGLESDRRLLPLLPVCARIDGRAFSRWTRDLARPYDERLSRLMRRTTAHLVRETGARVGYTQSDEISLLFYADDARQTVFFDGRVQKMASVLASLATAAFAAGVPELLPERAGHLATFDARVWAVPTKDEAANVFLWRELDATKNSLSMAARAHYPHEAVHGKNAAEMHDLLHSVGVNWNDYPTWFKRGQYVQRRTIARAYGPDEIAALPPEHDARKTPDLVVERTEVLEIDLPPLSRVQNRAAVLFDGAAPVTP